MRFLLCALPLMLLTISCQPRDARQDIVQLMEKQVADWNNGNLEGFMTAYWQNDSLMFISSDGLHYGWQTLYDRYTAAYAQGNEMGALQFKIFRVEQLSDDLMLCVGTWHLENASGLHEGPFSLNWRNTGAEWKIICDHTGTFE